MSGLESCDFVKIRKLPVTLSQNSSESHLMTALLWLLEASPGSWVRGVPLAVFFHARMLRDLGSCFLVTGLKGTHPAQMDHGLWGQMEKEQQVHWQSQHMGKSKREETKAGGGALNDTNIHLVIVENAPFFYYVLIRVHIASLFKVQVYLMFFLKNRRNWVKERCSWLTFSFNQ